MPLGIEDAPNAGLDYLENADGTSAVTMFTAGVVGSKVHRIKVFSGPTTAPGGTTNVVILHNDIIIDVFAMVNTVDTEQYDQTFSELYMGAGDTLKIQSRTALAAGATLHVAIYGADY